VPVAPGEIVFSVHDEGMLIGGDPDAVEAYIERLRSAAGRAR
jgi:hypothetical protein